MTDQAVDNEILAGGGRMGALMRTLNWSQTSFGPPKNWPQNLRTTLGILLASPFGIAIGWGPDLRLLYNDACLSILLPDQPPPPPGTPANEALNPFWTVLGPMFESAAAGDPASAETVRLRIHRKTGPEDVWFAVSISPIRDGTGEVNGVFAILTETTPDSAKSKAESAATQSAGSNSDCRGFFTRTDPNHPKAPSNALKALQHREEHLRSILASTPECVKIVAPDGTLIDINGAGLCMLEADTPEQVLGHDLSRWIAPESREAFRAMNQRVCAGNKETLEFEIIGLKGTRRRLETTAVPIADPKGAGKLQLAVTRDVTARNEATQVQNRIEQSLRRSEALYKGKAKNLQILNQIGCALSSELDLDKLVQSITDAGREVTGAAFGAFFYNVANEEGKSYMLYTLSGAPREAFEKFPMPRNTAIFNPTFQGDSVVRIGDVQNDPRFGKNAPHFGLPKGHLPVRSYLAAPVISRTGAVLGGLFFGHPEPDVFTEEAEQVLTAIAAQAAVAIDNANLYGAVQEELAAHKRAEEALRESEARFKALLENSATVIYIKGLDGRYLQINRWFEKLFKVTEAAIIGKTDFDFFPRDTAERFRENDLKVINTGAPVEIEEIAPQDDGPHSYLSVKFPLRRTDGSIYAVAGISTDITVRKRDEVAARRLAAIVGSSDDAIVGKDLTGIVTSWNQGAERIFGYRADEIVGRSITTIIPKDRHQEEHEIISRISRGERVEHFETIRQRKDGQLIEISLTISPIKDGTGKIIGASKIARNVTERKRIERQQAALYQLVATINRTTNLQEILRYSVEAVCGCQNADRASILLRDDDGVMRFKSWCRLSDAYRAAVEGHSPWSPDDPDPQPVWADEIASASLDPAVRAALEREGIRSMAFIPLKYESRLLGKFMVYYDTPHRFTPEEIRPVETIATQVVFAIERNKSGEALERLVNQRTASLREAVAQMEEFSYSVSHDLRSPVRAMHGYAKALFEDYADQLDDSAREYLQRIIQSSSRMERLIHDVLTYSRVSRMDIRFQPVSLDALVQSILRQYPELAPERADIAVQPDLPAVCAHEPSLGQAIANLLNNAVKFVATGVRPRVEITACQRDRQVMLRIRDNGIGIKPEHQHRLFGMFERIHPSDLYDGTGIGLAIVRKTVERMGGTVGLESDSGRGSTFWIQLPDASACQPS